MRKPNALLTPAFKAPLYDNLRKMGNPILSVLALCFKAKKVQKLQKGLFRSLD